MGDSIGFSFELLRLGAQAAFVAGLLGLLYQLRERFGPAPFFLTLGALQYFHVTLTRSPPLATEGLFTQPQGGVFLTASLLAFLLVHLNESPRQARDLLGALMTANIALGLLPMILGLGGATAGAESSPIYAVLAPLDLTSAMLGAGLLLVDALLLDAFYHFLSRHLPRSILLRLSAALLPVLGLDSLLYVAVRGFGEAGYSALVLQTFVNQAVGGFVLCAIVALLTRSFRKDDLEVELSTAESRDPLSVVTRRPHFDQYHDGHARDPLTGLFHRGFFNEVLPIEIARCERAGLPTSLIILDIDHFKQINDSYGHPEGDRVLQAIAEALRHSLRTGDAPCRIGGEEFAVILPRASQDAGRQIAVRIRAELPGRLANVEPHLVAMPTVTLGIATYPGDTSSVAELLQTADDRLYQGKALGRDCVVDSRGLVQSRRSVSFQA